MSDRSKIEWTEATWSPVTGCTRTSEGCGRCYIERTPPFRMQHRKFDGPDIGATTGVKLHSERLHIPLRWRDPCRIFVCSLADLLHDAVPDRFVADVFAVMSLAERHTFQVLTKRHARMRALLASDEFWALVNHARLARGVPVLRGDGPVRLPNVWVGVSVENQKWADIRIPALLDTPAAVRWISAEPLLGPVDLSSWLAYGCPECGHRRPWTDGRSVAAGDDVDEYWCQTCGAEVPLARCDPPGLSWVVVGGESGPGARPMHPDWPRSLRDQCVAAGVPFFLKQWGEWLPIGPLYDQHDDDEEADEARMDAVTWEVEERKRVVQLESSGHVAEGYQPTDPRTWLMARVGKKRAGRELDGRTWDEYPR